LSRSGNWAGALNTAGKQLALLRVQEETSCFEGSSQAENIPSDSVQVVADDMSIVGEPNI
jgi:hypothetical protein